MEALMHFIWEFRLCGTDLHCVDGVGITVLDPGRHNYDPGPDFLNAKIRIGSHVWVGDVEIHTRAADWYHHGHHTDPAYRSVILHVVRQDDTRVDRHDGQVIPQVIIDCNPDFNRDYNMMIDTSRGTLGCTSHLGAIPSMHLNAWVDRLGFERLQQKGDRIKALVDDHAGDWEQAVYITLARALGFNTNSQPMMQLAKAAPLHFMRKHSDSLEALEAILLGQAGLLDGVTPTNDYVALLQREYRFYRSKFNLSPLLAPGWRLNSTRPANSPYRRVALLAAMIHGGYSLVGAILEASGCYESLYRLFSTTLSPFWQTHFTLDSEDTRHFPALGRQSINSLIINVVAPTVAAYGETHANPRAVDRAIELLETLPPEQNRPVKMFTAAGISCPNAFCSQALIQMHKEYCDKRDCLRCHIGYRILSSRAVISSTTVKGNLL